MNRAFFNFRFLNFLSWLEGASLVILLLIAMPLKYQYGMPEVVSWVGKVHGVLFIVFNVVLFGFSLKGYLTEMQAFKGFIGSLVPFGTFIFSHTIVRPKLEAESVILDPSQPN